MLQLRHQLKLISVTVSHRLTDSCLNLWDFDLSQNEKVSLITAWKAIWQTLALSVSKQSSSITVGEKSHIWLASKPSGSHTVQSERIRWEKISLTFLELKTSLLVSFRLVFKGAPLLAISRLNTHILVSTSNSKQNVFGGKTPSLSRKSISVTQPEEVDSALWLASQGSFTQRLAENTFNDGRLRFRGWNLSSNPGAQQC